MTRILVYEDEASIKIIFEYAAKSLNKTFKIVNSPLRALEEIRTAGYDMVLLDMQNINFGGSFLSGGSYGLAQKVRDLQPGAIVIGYSVLPPNAYRDEAKSYFDELIEKQRLLKRNGKGEFEFLRNLFEKYNI